MLHRVDIPISELVSDHEFFMDMVNVNFPDRSGIVIIDAPRTFSLQFNRDGDLLVWTNWLVANGFCFTYSFTG